jgi:hypothetical protein
MLVLKNSTNDEEINAIPKICPQFVFHTLLQSVGRPTDCSNVCKSLLLIKLGCVSWIDKLRTRKRTSEIIKIFRKEKNVTGDGGHSHQNILVQRKQKKRTGSGDIACGVIFLIEVVFLQTPLSTCKMFNDI